MVRSRYGLGTTGCGQRRVTAVGQWWRVGGGVWPVCRRHMAWPWTRRHRTQGLGSAAHRPLDVGWPRARGPAAKTVRCNPVQMRISPNFQTKVHKGLITKVVVHATSYNFYKGHVVCFSTDCAQNACQDADVLCADE
jgi:hypothetical protein